MRKRTVIGDLTPGALLFTTEVQKPWQKLLAYAYYNGVDYPPFTAVPFTKIEIVRQSRDW